MKKELDYLLERKIKNEESRGHRKTDLFDEKEYPVDFKTEDGSLICLPYLAALVRLADEVDVAADRNDADIKTDYVME